MKLSVIICSHNPKKDILTKVVDSLKIQTWGVNNWELILVDNSSIPNISSWLNLSWHPNATIILEQKLGLSHARIFGVQHSTSDLIIFVDDDNILNPNYLKEALKFHQQYPQVGCFGGKSIPQFESQPPKWFFQCGINLGCQEYGDEPYISDYRTKSFKIKNYPIKAPIGTGMVILKSAFLKYLEEAQNDAKRMALGRKGKALTSGEDNDIILTLVKKGYEIAYVPSLMVTHLIPQNRYSLTYLKKMAYESNRSWVKVLEIHSINPWKKISKFSLPLRALKAFITHRPWQSEEKSIQYQAALGKFKGQSEI